MSDKISIDLKEKIAKLEEQNKALLAENKTLIGRSNLGDHEVEPGVIRHRIDLPASGGAAIVINGVEYFHGQEYNLIEGTYKVVLDIEHRAWAHEREIKGGASFDNAYRPKMNTTLSMRGQRQ